jgi:two-component system, chemotaxis family, chemotaxis protein CheY
MAKRVLIVDDAAFMRSMVREIFLEAGYEVVGEATHGAEAVQRYQELKPDLTTMDIVMPYKNGVEATREIVRTHPQAVVVICSALGQEALVLEALEAGAADFVVKPFRSEDLLQVVRKVLGEDTAQGQG